MWDDLEDHLDLSLDFDEPPIPTPATPPATQPRSFPTCIPPPIPEPLPTPPAPDQAAGTETAPISETLTIPQHSHYPDIVNALHRVFKLKNFRPKQLPAVSAAMEGKDVFVLFPTGSGKSLTFQLPAVCLVGVHIVVSPLMSLMHDQVAALRRLGVQVEQLSSSLSESERSRVKALLWSRNDKDLPRLLYVTPEQLQMSGELKSILQRLSERKRLIRFVIDEAHCITDWGRRFRDSYSHLSQLRKEFPNIPITALTATATPEVESDIITRLGLRDCVRLKLSFNRRNLDYEVRTQRCTADLVAQYIKENHPGKCGIVYCNSRDRCEEVAKALRDKHGLRSRHYHAMMDPGDKSRIQDEFFRGVVHVIVATVAFGMGIDKPDVRFVVHYSLPSTLAGYYQETGRAGRDGEPAACVLFYSYPDYQQRISQIRKEEKDWEEKRWQEEDVNAVQRYCINNVRCRRQQVLAFFEEDFDPGNCGQLCDNCRVVAPGEEVDHTANAIAVLDAAEDAKRQGKSLTRVQLKDVLRGSNNKNIREKGFDQLQGYGSFKKLSQSAVERLIDELHIIGVLDNDIQIRGDYPQNYVKV
ncbi:ATP-dependent RNA helicase, partial [Epithele typhae]|uniref:ATP-dependent RNA helicase n=1 Tax=Epithele typhae TaxID=378194 RepID=UPI0020087CC4